MGLINKSAVRESVDANVGAEVYAALSEVVRQHLQDAEERAAANGRKTIKARDV